jgi:hypothetical protein
VHLEALDSAVQAMRYGRLLPSCTSKVFINGAVLLERHYASKVSCSQFTGTPLSFVPKDRVSESRTLIWMVLLREAALAKSAATSKPAKRAVPLYIFIEPIPRHFRMHPSKPAFGKQS